MTDMNKIVDKIQKLLALAGNNPSQEEAETAALMAQQLIAKYNVDMANLTGEQEIKYKLLKATHSNNEGYRSPLAVIIANNFRCKPILLGPEIHFFGREVDVDACCEVFNYLYRVSHNKGLKLEREARKQGRSTRGVANAYWNGFMAGLQKSLDKQCKALMIVTPQDVKDKFQDRFPKVGSGARFGQRLTGFDRDAYETGYADGKSAMDKRSLTAEARKIEQG